MNERQQITVYKKDGTEVQINARPVVIEGFETEKFYTHTNVDNEPLWNISDSNGHTIGHGLKWYDAALDAERKLKGNRQQGNEATSKINTTHAN